MLSPVFAVGCLVRQLGSWSIHGCSVFSVVLPLMFAGIGTWATGMRESKDVTCSTQHCIFTPYLLILLALLAVIDAFVDFELALVRNHQEMRINKWK